MDDNTIATLLGWRASNRSNSCWPEERSHSTQSWLLFWKNNRGRDTSFLMSITGLLNRACISVIPAGTLCHIFRMLLLSYWFMQLIRVCAPNKHTNPKSWPWPDASLTQDTLKPNGPHMTAKGSSTIDAGFYIHYINIERTNVHLLTIHSRFCNLKSTELWRRWMKVPQQCYR